MEKKTQNCPLCGTLCEVIHEHIEGEKPVDEIWESFWKPIVSNEDGTINIEQVKKELADFAFVMEQVSKVYCHITGDAMSKVMYKAEDVIRVADDHFNKSLKEALKDEREGEPGAVWVKATTRLPEKQIYVIVRNIKTGQVKLTQNYGHNTGWDIAMDHRFKWDNTEWLDESAAAPSGEREVVFAEWMRLNCIPSQNGWVDALGKWDTTKGWYELFKQK